MNFFEQQRIAKKQTLELTVHFVIAVIFIIFVTNLLLFSVFKFYFNEHVFFEANREGILYFFTFFQLVLIFGGIVFKVLQLSNGGRSIANLLGGFPLEKTTQELNQKKIVNIVDEIAVASGVAAPPIYLLESELSINALVAGFDSQSAVIAITEGAIRHLDRDELQALVAHEFSHIFNGDMRFNTYLIGVLHGLQMISNLGEGLMRFGTADSQLYQDEKESHAFGKSWALGLCLYIIGYLGLILARAIKKQINIQREYLADATSVQYTRNGDALTSVFKKILSNKGNQFFRCGQQDIVSHMCFTEVTFRGKSHGVGSHPDLVERILRVQKDFDKESFLKFDAKALLKNIQKVNNERMPIHKSLRKEILEELEVKDINNSLSLGATIIMGLQASELAKEAGIKEKVKDSLGSFNSESLQYAREKIKLIPSEIIESIHNPATSRAAIYGIFSHITGVSTNQIEEKGEKLITMISLLSKSIKTLPRDLFLPIIEISLSSLNQLDKKDKSIFLKNLKSMVKQDNKINMQEFLYYTIIKKHISQKKSFRSKTSSLKELKKEVSFSLSLIAHAGFPEDPEGAQKALNKVSIQYFKEEIKLVPLSDFKISELGGYLSNLSSLGPTDKELMIKACIDTGKFGGQVIPLELEIIRAISSVLDVPLPLVI